MFIVVSMLAVLFSLAGCSETKEKPFEYDETQIVLDTMSCFVQYSNVSSEYANYYLTSGTDFEKSAVKGVTQARDNDKVGAFEDYSAYIYGTAAVSEDKYTITEDKDTVSVTVLNKAQNRDVEITVQFKENPEYFIQFDILTEGIDVEKAIDIIESQGYTVEQYLEMVPDYNSVEEIVEAIKSSAKSQLLQQSIYPYEPVEMVVSPVYSKKEMLGQAGRNTLIGMGTVFCVLIFISFIISLFKFLPALFAKKPKLELEKPAEKKQEAPKQEAKAAVANENLVNDSELVAVITAAIYAMNASCGNAVSKDTLVVRSIRRAKR